MSYVSADLRGGVTKMRNRYVSARISAIRGSAEMLNQND